MGTYDELLKLNQVDKAVGSKSKKDRPVKVSSPTAKKKQQIDSDRRTKGAQKVKQPRHQAPKQPSNQATMTPRYHDTMIEVVRKAVKQIGKEAGTHRFTEEEKRAIADIVYSYAKKGVRTSENEITRIAINFIVRDYEEHGEDGALDKVLKALSA